MKKAILILLTSLFSIVANAQYNKTLGLAINPGELAYNGVRLDFELQRDTGKYITVALQAYQTAYIGFYDPFGNRAYEDMHGIGITMNKTFTLTKDKKYNYFGGFGAGYKYYETIYSYWGWLPYNEDGFTKYKLGIKKADQITNTAELNLLLGKERRGDRLFMQCYIGARLRKSFIQKTENDIPDGDLDSPYRYDRTGITPILGLRLGIYLFKDLN